ncbi:hypothetical protein HPB49_008648 [Dermacentor silvarum]|uniref:Uncharacterized protein n=1 Tax=Dermacentor silvarum TaxID=543639 RepID=A0ACB8D453_DERSI|nr:hypothetical protein HPB49_008648 [Dermacentor silvarum]
MKHLSRVEFAALAEELRCFYGIDNFKEEAISWYEMWCKKTGDPSEITYCGLLHHAKTFFPGVAKAIEGTYSIVLMAVVDSQLRFVCVDVGAYGSQSDGGVFKASKIGKLLSQGALNLPPPQLLPLSTAVAPYVFVGDEAFQLRPDFLRPYPGRCLEEDLLLFNYRLSRARCVENAFGVLASRFRIFHRPMNLVPENARMRKKAYSFAIEAYCSPSSLRTNTCDSGLGIVHVHCTCFRSQKKSGRPYNVQLSVQSATGVPRTTTCECPAGKSGACSHILAAVRLLALLKQQGFAEPPPELSCTELPQQWRRPRQKGIKPASVLDVDWRAPREGVQLPVTARLSDASLDYQDEASQVAAIQSLGAELESLGDFPFAAVLLDVQAPLVKTKAGLAPADSPLTYQQSDRPHDFKTWMSSTIAPGAGTSCAVPRLALFTGAVQHTFPDVLTVDEQQILMHLQLAPEEAQDLEVNTRQQALSDRWHSARHHRLTASTFGRVIKRKEWTEKGLRNLLDPKDLSRVRAIQYGKKNESVAAERYATTMRAAGHNVTLQHCGLAVHPSCPWLGASPDRLAFDPEEGTYGVVEIKCPYSLKDSEANTVMLEEAKTKPHKYEEQLILHCQLPPSAPASFDASIPQNVTPILSRIDVSHQCQEVPTCSEAVIFLEREVHLCLRLEQLLLEDFTFIFKSVYFIALCGNHTLKTFHFTDRLATT